MDGVSVEVAHDRALVSGSVGSGDGLGASGVIDARIVMNVALVDRQIAFSATAGAMDDRVDPQEVVAQTSAGSRMRGPSERRPSRDDLEHGARMSGRRVAAMVLARQWLQDGRRRSLHESHVATAAAPFARVLVGACWRASGRSTGIYASSNHANLRAQAMLVSRFDPDGGRPRQDRPASGNRGCESAGSKVAPMPDVACPSSVRMSFRDKTNESHHIDDSRRKTIAPP